MEEFKPDVVLGFGILNARLAITQCRKRNIPFVYYIIDELFRLVPQKWFQGIAQYIERMNYRDSNLVLSINEALREYTIAMGAVPGKTQVIRAGIDLGWFGKADREKKRKELGIHPDDIVLFFMGWLYEFSGLLEVAYSLKQNTENNHIKTPHRRRRRAQGRAPEITERKDMSDRLILVGWQPYHEIPYYLAAADICILPAKK
jgi:glycosyltransferase involved in cell wall biosynthesis